MRFLKGWGIVLAVVSCQHCMQKSSLALAAEAAEQTAIPPVSAIPATLPAEPLLVEVFVNGRSSGTHLCFSQNGEYWIPFGLFIEQSSLKAPESGQEKTAYQTSLGIITFSSGSIKVIEQTPCISFSELKKTFLVAGRFNQSAFAIELDLPWQAGTGRVSREKEKVKPDIEAPNSSLSFLRIEPEITYDFVLEPEKNLFLEAGGRFAGGVWDFTLEGDPEKSFFPTRYHWTTYNRNLALRLGTGSSDIYPLISNNAFTGIQFGWNNHNILNQLDFERYSDSDVFLTLDRTQQRSIEGTGTPASIAELRLDGVVVARQRIGLNGRFTFSNVRMTSDLRKTEVYLYDRSLREKPLAVLDYTISIENRSLPAHELMIRGGGGFTGNPLDESGAKRSLVGFSHIQYGLSNRITLEAGVQNNPQTGSSELLAGSIISLGSNWAAALYGARSNEHYAADARLQGHGRNWELSTLSSWKDQGYATDDTEKEQTHSLRFSTGILDPIDIMLYGVYSRTGDGKIKKFLLPGVYWTLTDWLMLSALPDDDELYRYEANMRLGSQSDLSVVYDKKIVTADLRVDLSPSLISRVLDSYSLETGDNLSSLYLDWYPEDSHFDLIRLGTSYSGGQYGFSGSWSKFINAGMRFTLQYSYNMNNAHQLETDENFVENIITPDAQHFASFTLTWDMGFSGKKTYPINRSAISHTRGGLAGSLDIANDTSLKSSDINNVDILLNGRKLGQRQIDGTFFVGNLKPGIYSVDIDTEKLPLELNIARKSIKAEVSNGAVTEVNFPVYAEYGVAGCLSDSRGNGIPGSQLEIVDGAGNPIGQFTTDQFGYYRADGLRPGNYTVKTSGSGLPQEKSFTITNDFIFEVNLTVP